MTSGRPVLLINHRCPDESSGKPSGISNYLLSLTEALLDLDEMAIGLATSWRKEHLPKQIGDRLAFYEHVCLQRPRLLDVLKQAVQMPGLVRRNGVDFIINIDPIGTPRGGARRFTIIHDLYAKVLPGDYPTRERIFSDLIMRLMIRGSDKLVCVSDCTLNDLNKYYPATKGKACRVYPNASERMGITQRSSVNGGFALWVGTITPNKNIFCFYKALEELAERGTKVKAVVVGRDPQGIVEEAEALLEKAHKPVRFQNIDDEELSRLFSEATCFVNTSFYEGFGMPVIEAQRAGVATVCSSGGAVAEVGGAGAMSFDPHRPDLLADAMELLFNSDEIRSELILKGYENAKRFNWNTTAREMSNLLFERSVFDEEFSVDTG